LSQGPSFELLLPELLGTERCTVGPRCLGGLFDVPSVVLARATRAVPIEGMLPYTSSVCISLTGTFSSLEVLFTVGTTICGTWELTFISGGGGLSGTPWLGTNSVGSVLATVRGPLPPLPVEAALLLPQAVSH
jgi:hypothetical protein